MLSLSAIPPCRALYIRGLEQHARCQGRVPENHHYPRLPQRPRILLPLRSRLVSKITGLSHLNQPSTEAALITVAPAQNNEMNLLLQGKKQMMNKPNLSGQ